MYTTVLLQTGSINTLSVKTLLSIQKGFDKGVNTVTVKGGYTAIQNIQVILVCKRW